MMYIERITSPEVAFFVQSKRAINSLGNVSWEGLEGVTPLLYKLTYCIAL